MAAALQNVWHLRTVAETSARNYFFYICRGHLKDRGFCSPLEDPEVKKKEALRIETEKLQKEYQEKLAAKEKKEAEKKKEEKEKEKEKDSDDKSKKDNSDQKGKEKDVAIQSSKEDDSKSSTNDLPRVYSLHRNFYQMRLDRIRKAELAKRNKERLNNPTTFPTVPTGFP